MRWLPAVVLGVLLGALGVGPATAAGHHNSYLQLSRDGRHWTSHLSRPLFPATPRWVPGHRTSATFFVRNHSHQAATLTVDARAQAPKRAITRGFRITVRIGTDTWRRAVIRGVHHRLPTVSLRAGASTPVRVRAYYFREAGNRTEDARLPLRVTVRLTDGRAHRVAVDAPILPTHGSSAGSGQAASGPVASGPLHGLLPATGSAVAAWLLLLAAALIGSGARLVRRTHRSSTEEERHAQA